MDNTCFSMYLGRGVSRNNATQRVMPPLFAKRMLELDPAHIDEYNAIIARLEGKSANYGIKPFTHSLLSEETMLFMSVPTIHLTFV